MISMEIGYIFLFWQAKYQIFFQLILFRYLYSWMNNTFMGTVNDVLSAKPLQWALSTHGTVDRGIISDIIIAIGSSGQYKIPAATSSALTDPEPTPEGIN